MLLWDNVKGESADWNGGEGIRDALGPAYATEHNPIDSASLGDIAVLKDRTDHVTLHPIWSLREVCHAECPADHMPSRAASRAA